MIGNDRPLSQNTYSQEGQVVNRMERVLVYLQQAHGVLMRSGTPRSIKLIDNNLIMCYNKGERIMRQRPSIAAHRGKGTTP